MVRFLDIHRLTSRNTVITISKQALSELIYGVKYVYLLIVFQYPLEYLFMP